MMPDVKIIENGINKYLCFPKSKFSGEMSFNMLYMWPYEKNSIRKRVIMKAVLILFFRIFSKIKNDKTENSKTSIVFSVKHEPGALYSIINEFYQYKVNLTKIESRPNKGTPWEYNFYVDFEGHQDNSSIKEMLQKLKDSTSFLKILGSYPIAKLG